MSSRDLTTLAEQTAQSCDAYAQRDPAVWLHRLSPAELRAYAAEVNSRSSRGNEAVPSIAGRTTGCSHLVSEIDEANLDRRSRLHRST